MTEDGEITGLRGNGSEFPTLASISKVQIDDQTICTVMLRDITERKQAEEALQRRERVGSLAALATGLAHEIKNPLAALMTAAQAAQNVKDKQDASDKMGRILQNLLNSATRCNEIVDKLRKFVGGQNIERRSSDLNEVIRSAVESTQAFCESHNARIEWAVEQGLQPVVINAVEIELLLMNLIQNAAQSGETAERITIWTEETSDAIRVTVQDDGPGISEEAKQHAFEPFYSTRYGEGGTGLGLSIATASWTTTAARSASTTGRRHDRDGRIADRKWEWRMSGDTNGVNENGADV